MYFRVPVAKKRKKQKSRFSLTKFYFSKERGGEAFIENCIKRDTNKTSVKDYS